MTLPSPKFIVVEVQLARSLPVWNLVCFYGEPVSHKRRAFWECFFSKISSLNLHILCHGDFNAIFSQFEKSGGDLVNWNKIVHFNNFLSNCHLFDMGFHGAI